MKTKSKLINMHINSLAYVETADGRELMFSSRCKVSRVSIQA